MSRNSSKNTAQKSEWPFGWFEKFWFVYPRRVAKKAAFKALDRIRRSGEVEFDRLMRGVEIYAAACRDKDVQYIAHASTWLNQGRWDDEPAALAVAKPKQSTNSRALDLARQIRAAEESQGLWGNAGGSDDAV